MFDALFTPLDVGRITVRNRILSSGHDTVMSVDGFVSDQLVEYQRARAAGGVGHIVLQVSSVHHTSDYTAQELIAVSDDSIPGYRRVAEAVHEHDCHLFAQLFHGGREIMSTADGMLPIAWAPSSVPNERFHVMPKPLTHELIDEIVDGFGAGARRMAEAGIDGVEIVASHGYLPAQFLNPRTNLRDDVYGGSLENRLRFTREVIAAIRAQAGDDIVLGMRISVDERDLDGLTPDESVEACAILAESLDYLSISAGSSATYRGSVHIAPPMSQEPGYTAPLSAAVRARVDIPVFVTGRINTPAEAERIITAGHADAVAMTRALICDPLMPAKAKSGLVDEIRLCIGCNQACIGHFHLGVPISCIQYPESGREREFGARIPAERSKRVIVVGGGPAGLKAAAVAAERGHDVEVWEAAARVGGQVLLAQQLPRRSEFGGLIENLQAEALRAGVRIRTSLPATIESLVEAAPDEIILATGARPYVPEFELGDGVVLDAWQVIRGETLPDGDVLVADWRCDWIGLGVATLLAEKGRRVTLAVDGWAAGQNLQQYVRNEMLGHAVARGVKVVTDVRVRGFDDGTAYLGHTLNGEVVEQDGIAALVLATGHVSYDELSAGLAERGISATVIGDAMTPRTAEEAVLEGLRAGVAL
ncbi:MAG: FAD-dependent oxidoreductase [Actinobacteria bacterium]|nr:FAD-dependent oxidoreductase [Actinomycetota bacterium]